MEPKKILFLCDASDIDIVEKSFADNHDYNITIETTEKILNYGVRPYLKQTIELINQNPDMYDGVIGTHDSSAVFAAIICEHTGKNFASPQSVVNCQNKYICRRIQKEVIPQNTPHFCLDSDYLQDPSQLSTPFFIKPVRANISFGSHKVNSSEELKYYIQKESKDIAYYNQYFFEALEMSSEKNIQLNLSTCNLYLCEDFIPGTQVTVDGFVCNKEVEFFGYTKAEFYEHSNSFSHHVFPYNFPLELDQAINTNLRKLILRLGIDNSFFNVELRANEHNNTFYIIEVNSRIAFQFAMSIQQVRGFDPLHLLCDLAVGKKPDIQEEVPSLFRYCFNFELHSFSDQKVLKTPTQSEYENIKLHYPEVHIRNLIQEKYNLSDYKHNPESFRYCILDIPGNSKEEIMNKYKEVISMLKYEFGTLD